MILDKDLQFSDAQAVTAAAASDNYVDLGVARGIGHGENLVFAISVDTTFTDSSSNSTLAVTLETDDNTSFSSAATVATLVTIPAVTVAGTKYFVKLPIATTVPYERYIRVYFTPANGDLTTGAVSVELVKDADQWTSYASGFSTGI